MTAPGRRSSTFTRLLRHGFIHASDAERLLDGPDLAPLRDDPVLLEALGATADPDLALGGLVRLLEAQPESKARRELLDTLIAAKPLRDRLLGVLGASTALGDHLARHSGDWRALVTYEPRDLHPGVEEFEHGLADAADPVGLRVAYRRCLLSIAARDVCGTTDAGCLGVVAVVPGGGGCCTSLLYSSQMRDVQHRHDNSTDAGDVVGRDGSLPYRGRRDPHGDRVSGVAGSRGPPRDPRRRVDRAVRRRRHLREQSVQGVGVASQSRVPHTTLKTVVTRVTVGSNPVRTTALDQVRRSGVVALSGVRSSPWFPEFPRTIGHGWDTGSF